MTNDKLRPAELLLGAKLDGGWVVTSKISKSSVDSRYLSVCYRVERKDDKKKAFLKVLDYTLAMEQPDPSKALHELTEAFDAEREILSQCKGSRLHRVAFSIADGTFNVEGFGVFGKVSYLIFDSADGDIRKQKELWQDLDLAWCLRSLHQSAVGLMELHGLGIAHQDLKPSKILVFNDSGCKVSDLERASHKYVEASEKGNFKLSIGYMAPEQWYGWHFKNDHTDRFMSDIYQLGSLIFFFFIGCSATQAIDMKLSKNNAKSFTKVNFEEDLPYIKQAFGEVLFDLKKRLDELDPRQSDEILELAAELCEPDPRLRGDKKVLAYVHVPRYDLQRYVSRFNILARREELRLI